MFSSMFNRKKFSIRRNATKRWKHAVSGSECINEPLSVIIKDTSMNVDQQKQAVEIANMALDTCRMENEIATYIKREMDELMGKTWHVIVGRNFGSHIEWERFIHFTAAKVVITIGLVNCAEGKKKPKPKIEGTPKISNDRVKQSKTPAEYHKRHSKIPVASVELDDDTLRQIESLKKEEPSA